MSEILVVREKDVFTETLIENGFSVVNFPTIKTEAVSDLSELESFIARIETFDGVFTTSSAATEIVLTKLIKTGKVFAGKFYVLGKRSADLLKKSGYEYFYSQEATTAEEFLKLIPEENLRNKKFLFARGNRSLRVVPETLCNQSEIVETVVYRTTEAETDAGKIVEIKEKLARGKFVAACFFSPSGVEEFLKKFENFSQNEIKIAAIGRTTARFVESQKLRVDLVAAKPTAKAFANELSDYLRKEI